MAKIVVNCIQSGGGGGGATHKVQAVPAWGELNAAKKKISTIINGSSKWMNP